MLSILTRTLAPKEGTTITCPRCWQPISAVHFPRWAWLVMFKQYQPVSCPCHHVLGGRHLQQMNQQAEAQS